MVSLGWQVGTACESAGKYCGKKSTEFGPEDPVQPSWPCALQLMWPRIGHSSEFLPPFLLHEHEHNHSKDCRD